MISNNYLLFFVLSFSVFSINAQDKEAVAQQIDHWHQAAANADFETYFMLMTEPGVFVGTDATEHWDLKSFKAFSKPYFDRGRAWSFTSLDRHIYLDDDLDTAYFDELLDTQMGICRGSGVMKKVEEQWKVAHYVLSIAVPNDQVDALLELKKEQDDALIKQLKKQE